MTTETFTPGGLLLSGEVKTMPVTIASGADVAAGAVLGRITSGGKYKLSTTAASDGSETPVAVALHAIEASGADATAAVAFQGTFDAAKLVYGASHTAATVNAAWRAAGAPLFAKTLA